MAIIVNPLNYIYKIKIGDVAIHCKQLSYRVRSQIVSKCSKQTSGLQVENAVSMLFEVLKHSIIKVEGFNNPDGSPFELQFENGFLTDDCLDQLLYVERVGDILQLCASNFINMKAPDEILDPTTGDPIEDVSIEKCQPNKKKS